MTSNSLEPRRRAAESALDPPPPPPSDRPKEKCPRCESRDTKFCYYNNYNTSQPRHFCKSCRRYWTLGGSLRNVPIGGASRKRHRPNPSPATSPSDSSSAHADHHLLPALLPSGFLALGEPFLSGRTGFGFDLALGLGLKPGPVDELGFGLGSAALVWPASLLDEEVTGGGPGSGDTWRMESGVGECFGVPAPANGGGGGAKS